MMSVKRLTVLIKRMYDRASAHNALIDEINSLMTTL